MDFADNAVCHVSDNAVYNICSEKSGFITADAFDISVCMCSHISVCMGNDIIAEKKRKIERTGLDIASCLTYNPVQSHT